EDVTRAAELAVINEYAVGARAIGERGNREVLDIYEETFKRRQDKATSGSSGRNGRVGAAGRGSPAAVIDGKNLRWRIEHAQHLNAADIPRFAQLGVIASMQGIHATSDAPFVLARLGDRKSVV